MRHISFTGRVAFGWRRKKKHLEFYLENTSLRPIGAHQSILIDTWMICEWICNLNEKKYLNKYHLFSSTHDIFLYCTWTQSNANQTWIHPFSPFIPFFSARRTESWRATWKPITNVKRKSVIHENGRFGAHSLHFFSVWYSVFEFYLLVTHTIHRFMNYDELRHIFTFAELIVRVALSQRCCWIKSKESKNVHESSSESNRMDRIPSDRQKKFLKFQKLSWVKGKRKNSVAWKFEYSIQTMVSAFAFAYRVFGLIGLEEAEWGRKLCHLLKMRRFYPVQMRQWRGQCVSSWGPWNS